MRPAVRIENLSKLYRIGASSNGSSYRTLREALSETLAYPVNRIRRLSSRVTDNGNNSPSNSLWALKDISFDISPGEAIGIIGRNGAGKSTLLKILSRITKPTRGSAQLIGRVGSLLEVGTGFHPELTGRENIYMNGSILGMTRREIRRKFDEIVAFSEMERFLDTPVKRYSSGMYVRLAFAVAAHLDLEILLVDEILAVGDLDFQKKCLKRMDDITHTGRTVILVSHNLGVVHNLCGRSVLLHQGRLKSIGPTRDVIETYLSDGLDHKGTWERPTPPAGDHDVFLRRARVLNLEGNVVGVVRGNEEFVIELEYEVTTPVPNFEAGVQFRNSHGVTVFTSLDSDTSAWPHRIRPRGVYRSSCRVPGHLLSPGTYYITLGAAAINQQTYDTQHDVLPLEVSETGCVSMQRNDHRVGVIMPVLNWVTNRFSAESSRQETDPVQV